MTYRTQLLAASLTCLASLTHADDTVGAQAIARVVHGSLYAVPAPDLNQVLDLHTGLTAATSTADVSGAARVVALNVGSPTSVATLTTGHATAAADYSAGNLRSGAVLDFSASNGWGTAGASGYASMGDILTLSAPATVTLAGIWDGNLSSTASSLVGVSGSLHLTLRSLSYTVEVSDGEGGSHFETTSDLFGDYSQQIFLPGSSGNQAVHEPFSVTALIPAGQFYFSATLEAAVNADANRTGGAFAGAGNSDFTHTLDFGFNVPAGVTLTSATGSSVPMAAVPEPAGGALVGGMILVGWACWRRQH